MTPSRRATYGIVRLAAKRTSHSRSCNPRAKSVATTLTTQHYPNLEIRTTNATKNKAKESGFLTDSLNGVLQRTGKVNVKIGMSANGKDIRIVL